MLQLIIFQVRIFSNLQFTGFNCLSDHRNYQIGGFCRQYIMNPASNQAVFTVYFTAVRMQHPVILNLRTNENSFAVVAKKHIRYRLNQGPVNL